MNSKTDFAFLDSGTGGIPYMKEVKKLLPSAKCLYLGDTANFPYGQKSKEEITECASAAVKNIIQAWEPRVLIIACNTISVTSLPELRKEFSGLSIVGTVPAIRLAARISQNKNIGLLATNATVNHPYNKKLIADFASACKVFNRGDPELVSFIEHSLFAADREERLKAVKPATDFFAQNNCDTIILGCTHFTHMAADIQDAAGKNVHVVDSRDGVARQALKIFNKLGNKDTQAADSSIEDQTFFVTGAVSKEQEEEYAALCKTFNIPWGGKLQKN